MPDPWKPELGHCIRDRWQFLLCTVRIYITSECHLEPWPVWLECHPTTKGVRVPLQIRAFAWVVGSIPSPSPGVDGWPPSDPSLLHRCLPLSPSLSPPFSLEKQWKTSALGWELKKDLRERHRRVATIGPGTGRSSTCPRPLPATVPWRAVFWTENKGQAQRR